MNLADYKYIKENLVSSELFGSDSSLGNIFLLQPKYETELQIYKKILIRKYNGTENRNGYAFPLFLQSPISSNSLFDAVSFIFSNNKNKTDIKFCLITQEQKNQLDEVLRNNFPNYKIDWKTDRNDCDYIYLQEKLSALSGSALQKKKNHISRFNRAYENRWEFKLFPQENISSDILKIEDEWFEERSNDIEKAFDSHSLLLEKNSIHKALENADWLDLSGAVIYIDGKPSAMCLASPISDKVLDIHFEKVLISVAENGGYAAINNLFAKTCTKYKYINREEDMGVEGLRKSKLSYKPEILLDKFYGQVIKC